MHRMGSGFIAALAVVLMTVTACSRDEGDDSSVSTSAPEAAARTVEEEQIVAEQIEEAQIEEAQIEEAAVVDSELAGTSWQLVKISSMDDSVIEPEDGSLYTLLLRSDGTASVRADCNLGNGSWTSESTGQLQFGLLATTRAMCMPGSLSDPYLKQFEWIRSYVFRDGHLFLATMADGSIIEFEPAETE